MTIFTPVRLIACLFMLFTLPTFAQNGVFDARMTLFDTDLVQMKLYVDIEVKAHTATNTFNLADQNYRFSFNRAALAPNSAQIEQELAISGFVSQAGTNSFYNAHTLNGSLDTVVSYNVELSGGDGYPLTDTDWIGVGRVVFDIVDVNECYELAWHDAATFPPTFVGENFNNLLFATGEGGYEALTSCSTSINPYTDKQLKLNLYPTLSNGLLSLIFEQDFPSDLLVQITSATGQLLYNRTYQPNSATLNETLDVSSFPSGLYHLHVQTPQGIVAQTFIRQ